MALKMATEIIGWFLLGGLIGYVIARFSFLNGWERGYSDCEKAHAKEATK